MGCKSAQAFPGGLDVGPNPPNMHAHRGESDHDAKHVFDANLLRRHGYLETWLEQQSHRTYAPACLNIIPEHIHKYMNIPQQSVPHNHHMHMDIKMCIYTCVHVHISIFTYPPGAHWDLQAVKRPVAPVRIQDPC